MILPTKETYDDILIVPQYSDIENIDEEISTFTTVGNIFLEIPIISAAMTTVTDTKMQMAMRKLGGIGIHHRYDLYQVPPSKELERLKLWCQNGAVAVSPSMGYDLIIKLIQSMTIEALKKTPFVIDVAHGHRKEVLDYARFLKSNGLIVWSGNITTPQAAYDYCHILDAATDALKLGIGSGSACTTRVVSGCGYPLASAIHEIAKEFPSFSLIADGGIKYAGDITKAIALGADAVIIGGLLAGTDEAPGEVKLEHQAYYKYFEGMASESALQQAGKTVRVEGVSGKVPYRGSLKTVLNELVTGLKLGMAYTGSRTIVELRARAKFVKITDFGVLEGKPRI